MGFSKVWLMFLLLALAMVAADSTTLHEASWGLARFGNDDTNSCISGHCNVEDQTEMLMDSEINHRRLAAANRRISYGALRANSVPCNSPGQSYYNCQGGGMRANPYNLACSTITACKRSTG